MESAPFLLVSATQLGLVYVMSFRGNLLIGQGTMEFRKQFREALTLGKKKIVLNFLGEEGVGHVDSAGIGEIVACYTDVEKAKGRLVLCCLHSRVLDKVTIARLPTRIDVYTTLEEALQSFGGAYGPTDQPHSC